MRPVRPSGATVGRLVSVDPGLYARSKGDPVSLPSWSCSACPATGTAWSPRLAYLALVEHVASEHVDEVDPSLPADWLDRTPAERSAYVDSFRTARGGWSREVLASWGVSWPPPRGWRRRLCGLDE
jgi:hypothetical protein